MIVSLEGQLEEVSSVACVMNCNGVGYEVNVPLSVVEALPAIGSKVKLFTYPVYREDSQALYGFLDKQERNFFKVVVEKVSGVGPKIALAMLSKFRSQEIKSAIISKNISLLSSITGIGKKTAERMIIELGEKLSQECIDNAGGFMVEFSCINSNRTDAVLALVSLGIKPSEAEKMISAVAAKNSELSAEQLIRLALQ
ncbi:MAG: Holliday junction branch migration protein RuvA [Puniceicoccales bacterium]|nr:Holliday junction branch migration protein RuvA [Puniceicoccales bacterium]